MKDHPALFAYHIEDEPESSEIDMFAEAVKKINPQTVLMSHILELGHAITKWRWSYQYGVNECKKLNRENVYLPVWGEKIILKR
jgi:hypothetical protein